MPPSLRLNLLRDGQVLCLAEGLTALAAFAARLDGMCAGLGVAPLTQFMDTTDAEADLDELDLLIDDGSHLAAQGTWHPAAALLATVQALQTDLAASPRRFGILSNKYKQVCEELTRCAGALQALPPTVQAHLLVLG